MMDSNRRAELLARRELLREQIHREEQLGSLREIRDALAAAGEEFEVLTLEEYREIPGCALEWVPQGYSRIAWELAPPAEDTWFRDDIEAAETALLSALHRCAGPGEQLLIVVDGRPASLRMTREALERHAGLFIEWRQSKVWITAPPKQWVIELSLHHVRVGDAFPVDATESRRDAFFNLLLVLEEARADYADVHIDSPHHPDLPNITRNHPIPPVRVTLPAEPASQAWGTVLKLVEDRLTPGSPVQLILLNEWRLHMSFEAFAAHVERIFEAVTDLNISAPAADWYVHFRRRTQTWVEAAGSPATNFRCG